uniref:Candidate secreted effector n=1 Tax=Meloidogyne incognita TaxID=6306 RepID=A0A914LMK0_MELIC
MFFNPITRFVLLFCNPRHEKYAQTNHSPKYRKKKFRAHNHAQYKIKRINTFREPNT